MEVHPLFADGQLVAEVVMDVHRVLLVGHQYDSVVLGPFRSRSDVPEEVVFKREVKATDGSPLTQLLCYAYDDSETKGSIITHRFPFLACQYFPRKGKGKKKGAKK